ncbi:hypothetical protein AJ80_03535 [Polytolypa hystricis UAMH7299]|uniref:Pal1 cell morphology protein n=1 Tax=Polytolypa hystricis (strain UAMH7299) TaxID=1447883 RepID=A0A2B7YGT6_POLH7|nr:hypothetical protein AJ80_03535 [Polytolypa hystricis UAMH7299]
MSLAPISVPDRQPSPRLTVNLGSNNPFRNLATSPTSLSPPSPGPRPPRPLSTNPFLDDSESLSLHSAIGANMSPNKPSPGEPPLTGHALELFENLSLDSKPSKPVERRPAPPRPENVPPHHRPSQRQPRRPSKDEPGSRREGRPRRDPLDIFADPEPPKAGSHRRPRRNSDSSLMERPPKPMSPEDERRRRERRRGKEKEREREGSGKSREGKSRSKRGPGYKLDIIDKLDVTSIYGAGLFHHDGPFDACNPHRNRKGVRAAPMQAFPKDSRNMALGGAGPNNSNLDLNLFHGRTTEGYTDFGSSVAKYKEPVSFSSTTRVEPIHGAESMGLGTSTFLEGAPASRVAIQQHRSEEIQASQSGGGLQRKKSLAQKIRGINTRSSSSGRMTSPEPYLDPGRSTTSPIRSASSRRRNDKNPFFQDYDDAYDKKSAKIQEATDENIKDDHISVVRPRATSSPKVLTETIDGAAEDQTKPAGPTGSGSSSGGFMNRVKSLRRPRPERRGTTHA